MIDKLSLIRQILDTNEETDRKILSVLQKSKDTSKAEKTVHIEERTGNRKPISLDVDINTGTEKIVAETDNISETGAFIRTEKKVSPGEDIAIRIVGPGGEDFGFIAEVVRADTQGLGVKIKGISQANKQKFQSLVEKA